MESNNTQMVAHNDKDSQNSYLNSCISKLQNANRTKFDHSCDYPWQLTNSDTFEITFTRDERIFLLNTLSHMNK